MAALGDLPRFAPNPGAPTGASLFLGSAMISVPCFLLSRFDRRVGERSNVAVVRLDKMCGTGDGDHVLAGQSRLHGAVEPGAAFERQVG